MRRSQLPSVVRLLMAEVPDADLLERYVLQRDDDAFAQLVTRYSRLVWGQCRNLLPNDADADDAFQATFLTLARSVKSIRPGAPLGPWLHGVAFRVCKNAQRANSRRAKREKASAQPEANRPVADSTWEEAFAAMAEEVQKLPESQRLAFVLCCIEGRACTEVAASLGQKLGTFSARLTRAKQTMLDRLAKRGFGAGVLALGGVTGSVALAPAALIARTLTLLPPGVAVPSSVLTLTYGVTGMMIRFKLLAAGVLVASGIGMSVGTGWYGSATAQVPGADTKPTNIEQMKMTPKAETIDQLKANLEKAKAFLAKAEAEEAAKQVEVHSYVRKVQLLLEAQAAPQFEYIPLQEGISRKEFETILADRETKGWNFIGEVTIDDHLIGGQKVPTPTLVFRKPTAAAVDVKLKSFMNLSAAREAAKTPATVAPPTPPAAPAVPNIAMVPTPANVAKMEAGYQAQIARLEQELLLLRARLATPAAIRETQVTVTFTKQDFGNWDPPDLYDVIRKVMAEDMKKYGDTPRLEIYKDSFHDSFHASGTSEYIAAVTAWVKKLKK